MQKIGDSTGTANADGEFTEGNAGAGVDATLIKARWLNVVQRELVNTIEGLGVALDPENDSQLLEALEKLAGETAEWDAIKSKPASFPPEVHTHVFSGLGQIPLALLALSRITSVSANTVLTAAQMGLVLIDANAAARTITLPPSIGALGVADVIVRRTDNSGNRLVVQAAGTDKIKFHTHLNADGYPFLVLMGAGDWWHLRSDGAGSWWPLGRYDNTPLGHPVAHTTTAISPGGWGLYHGLIYNRADWPWTWDHAKASGMLTTEALRAGMDGCWTSGDGALTFRSPEGRADFVRFLDESRGIDIARLAGSRQLDALQNITGQYSALNTTSIGQAFSGAFAGTGTGINFGQPTGSQQTGVPTVTFNAARVARTADETRSVNIANPGRIKLI